MTDSVRFLHFVPHLPLLPRNSPLISDGSNKQQLTFTDDHSEVTPRFSPDGENIAFTKVYKMNGYADIFIMNANGGSVTQITQNINQAPRNLNFTPDGSAIITNLGERIEGKILHNIFSIWKLLF